MKKYIFSGSALLLFLTAYAQQESTFTLAEIKTNSHQVIQVSGLNKNTFRLPKSGMMHEFHEGSRLFSTNSKRSKLNGNWQSWYTAGHPCDSGRLVNNLPHGEWKFWDEKGVLKAIRTYDADKFSRVYEEIQRYNPRRSFYQIGAISQKNRLAALHYLRSEYSFPLSREKKYFNSLRQLVQSNINGTYEYQPVFTDCLHEGLYMNFFATGQVKDSGYYKDGLRHGKWEHYDAAGGNRWEGAYQNGIRVKEWKLYNDDNRLKEIVRYDHGEISWRKNFNN